MIAVRQLANSIQLLTLMGRVMGKGRVGSGKAERGSRGKRRRARKRVDAAELFHMLGGGLWGSGEGGQVFLFWAGGANRENLRHGVGAGDDNEALERMVLLLEVDGDCLPPAIKIAKVQHTDMQKLHVSER